MKNNSIQQQHEDEKLYYEELAKMGFKVPKTNENLPLRVVDEKSATYSLDVLDSNSKEMFTIRTEDEKTYVVGKAGSEFIIRAKLVDSNATITSKYSISSTCKIYASLYINGIGSHSVRMKCFEKNYPNLEYEAVFTDVLTDLGHQALLFEEQKLHFFHDVEDAKRHEEMSKNSPVGSIEVRFSICNELGPSTRSYESAPITRDAPKKKIDALCQPLAIGAGKFVRARQNIGSLNLQTVKILHIITIWPRAEKKGAVGSSDFVVDPERHVKKVKREQQEAVTECIDLSSSPVIDLSFD